ncbi:LIC_10190 family membrane protein [Viscerimonas tarda]
MLSILISWLIISFIFFVFGKILVGLCRIFDKKSEYGLFDTFFLGVCFAGSTLPVISFLFPVNGAILWLFLVIAACYTVYLYRYKKDYFLFDIYTRLKSLPLLAKGLLALLILVVGLYSLLPPLVWDTRLYYLQAMMWNESYRIIPGLANLHGRFGFNSNLLLMSSAFSLKDLFGFRPFGLLGLNLIVMLSWVVLKIVQSKTVWLKLALSFFVFIFLHCYSEFISSPSTDVLPNILVSYILLKAFLDKDALTKNPLVFWALPIFSLTLKLSVIPICLLSLFVLIAFIKRKAGKPTLALLVIALLIIAPWCVRNILLTGYLIYPFPAVDLFSFDWKIPVELVKIEKEYVSSWAKTPGLTIEQFNEMSSIEWMKIWLLKYINYGKLYLSTFCLAGISPVILLWLKKRNAAVNTSQIVVWITAVLGSIFWFIMAPDVRFGFSFILMAGIIPVMMFDISVKKDFLCKGIYVILFAGLVYVAVLSEKQFEENIRDKSLVSFLYSPQTLQADGAECNSYRVGNTELYISASGFCGDACFPCIITDPNILEMRGDKIEDGFRTINIK